jgi:glutamine amidotransferase
MSRLLGIISTEISPFERSLFAAPRSLPSLSNAQPDGWGAAVYDDGARDWRIETRALHAGGEQRLPSMAARLRGAVLVAHVRERTAGAASATAQPFHRGKWVFAHDGEIAKRDYLLAGASSARLGERTGDTDSELLFAYVLTRLDRGRVTERAAASNLDAVVDSAVGELVERQVGAINFILSDGVVMYAHRYGRSLCLSERRELNPTVAIASEPLTDDAWCPLDEWTLVRCERASRLEVVFLRGADPRESRKSDIELPFTD